MSSHLTLGTSTWVYLNDEGLTELMANLKCYCVTHMASRI